MDDNNDIPELEATTDSDCSDEYEEADFEQEQTKCLFCKSVFQTIENGIQHLNNEHNIKLEELQSKFQMDQYSFIKLINCVRKDSITAKQLLEANKVFWNDDKYLKPLEYETWLSFDYTDLPQLTKCSTRPEQTSITNKKFLDTNEIGLMKSLYARIEEQTMLLEQASEDMEKMKLAYQRLFDQGDANKNELQSNSVSQTSLQKDESYFDSYSHFGIHQEMLSDVVRTTSYRDALLLNKTFVGGKDVLDVGCGTAILSIFASQAGANKVIGVDNSDVIYNAMDIIRNNNVDNVTLIKGRLEDTKLPQEKYDIIISEWMGYFLLFEGMLDSIIYARDNHLKAGGTILPNRCTMSLIGYGSDDLFGKYVTFWNNVYELDMSNMRKEVMHEPLIEIVDPQHIITDANTIADLNMLTVELNYSNFTYNFNLTCKKDGKLSAFVGYFDTYFDLPNPVMFGTSPQDKPTHWKQVVFFLDDPKSVEAGSIITGEITCKRSQKNARSLDIAINVFNKKFTYFLH